MAAKSSPARNTALEEEVDRRLARAGQRWTKGRRSVVDAMAKAKAPMSVPDVQSAVGSAVPLSSLYRIISDLVDAKVLFKLEFAQGFARFELDEELAAWRNRPLSEIAYLILDARYEKVRHGGAVVPCAVLTAVGITPDGKRSVLGCSVARSEAETHWRGFLEVFAFPAAHRKRLRTNNGLERVNKEIKRRARVATLFPNEASVLRFVSAVLSEISDDWETQRPYPNMKAS